MVPVPLIAVLLGLALCLMPPREAVAQYFSVSDAVYEAARNKIGLIRYCRNTGLLDSATAEEALTAVESGLLRLPASNAVSRARGDLAQEAGEDGFWEAGRRRDLASVAKLFQTTPADLCQEWAEETLRSQEPERRAALPANPIEIKTVPAPDISQVFPRLRQPPNTQHSVSERKQALAMPRPAVIEAQPDVTVPPLAVIEPQSDITVPRLAVIEPQPAVVESQTAAIEAQRDIAAPRPAVIEPQPVALVPQPPVIEPQPEDLRPAPAVVLMKAIRSAVPPPIPSKAPWQRAASEQTVLHTTPTGSYLPPAPKAAAAQNPGNTGVTPAALSPQPPRRFSLPDPRLSDPRLAADSNRPAPYLRDVVVPEGATKRPTGDGRPSNLSDAWPFNRLGKSDKCLLAGCKWPSPEERRAAGY